MELPPQLEERRRKCNPGALSSGLALAPNCANGRRYATTIGSIRATRILLRAPLHLAHRAARGAGGECGIGLERGRHVALAANRLPGGIAFCLFRCAALGELLVGD